MKGFVFALSKYRDLLSFGGCDLQREALPPNKVDIIIEHATKVNKVRYIDRFDSVAYLFLCASNKE